MKRRARSRPKAAVEELQPLLVEEALKILEEDRAMCRAIGAAGAGLIREGEGVLTHCNAGGLATSGYGTALAPIYTAWEKGVKFRVYADETRPLLQGARLTVWELMKAGVDVTLICDNAAATLMKQGRINLAITGADRVAANGDAANKIGTYGAAVLARAHGLPFYMAWPASTLDLSLLSGEEIPIEERSGEEVTAISGHRIAPAGAKAANPAFDVTPHKLITAFITDQGLVYPPFEKNLKKLFGS
jgi:methylthioribose-1-phosphate isomerase